MFCHARSVFSWSCQMNKVQWYTDILKWLLVWKQMARHLLNTLMGHAGNLGGYAIAIQSCSPSQCSALGSSTQMSCQGWWLSCDGMFKFLVCSEKTGRQQVAMVSFVAFSNPDSCRNVIVLFCLKCLVSPWSHLKVGASYRCHPRTDHHIRVTNLLKHIVSR